ncbi:SMP-30/gluconolactonase/LRE family protein [Bacteroidota bacterium]
MSRKLLITIIGIIVLLCTASSQKYSLVKVWETDTVFQTPESVVYDALRDRLYVSNYNRFPRDLASTNDFISALDLDGNIVKLKWITGLIAPCGISIHADHLYIAERDGISKYNIETEKLIEKISLKTGFLNDVAIGKDGIVYFTDTSPRNREAATVCAIKQGRIDTIADEPINRVNGLLYHEGSLLVGNSGDLTLKRIDLESREVFDIVKLDTGIIDGIKNYQGNEYLVSHWSGNLYLVSSGGTITELLNTRKKKISIADFEYIKELNLVIIPTFGTNRVIAYRIEVE